jgi:hypothetical protein
MKFQLKDDRVLISLKRRELAPSKSGKTLVLASTRGTRRSKIKIRGKWVRVNANVFIDADHPKKKGD